MEGRIRSFKSRRMNELSDDTVRDICREVKFDTIEDVSRLQLHVASLQNHALSFNERLTEIPVRQQEILKRFASQLFHWVLKVHATLPATGLRDSTLMETDKDYIEWDKVFKQV